MCGIVGYVGKDNAIEVLHNGLKKLEYRGYDSAGIAFFGNDKLKIIKKAGTVDNLFEHTSDKVANIGIGHTRWATHGKATDQNSHPHKSFYGKVCLVHNGIVENFLELKNTYLKNTKFASETDTEIVANLIEKFYIKTNNKLKSIFETIKLLKGSFALAILFDDDTENIYFAKQTSPLCLGISKTGNMISSDILGLNKKTKKYVDLQDGDFGKISKNRIEIYDKDFKQKNIEYKNLQKNIASATKQGYPHFMIKEIYEIPQVIKNTAKIYASKNSPLKKINESYFNFVERIMLVACGTSYHACKVGEILLQNYGFDATSQIASEFICTAQTITKNTLCIFVSQSGETADTISAVNIAKKYGAKTVCITNVVSSNITKICDYTLPINCGAEIAVASTKAYIGQLVALHIFAEFLYNQKTTFFKKAKERYLNNNYKNVKIDEKNKKISKKLQNLCNFIDTNDFNQQSKILVKEVINAKNVFMLGKSLDFVTAMEAALKLKEISYINCVAYPSGELKHGTISLIDKDSLTFVFATQENSLSKNMNIIKQIKSRGGKIAVITQFDELLNSNEIDFKISLPCIDENLIEIVSVIPMQLLAYNTATKLGHNPDKPRNLAKSVTVE